MELEGVRKFYRAPVGLQCSFGPACGIGQPFGARGSTRPVETEPGPQIAVLGKDNSNEKPQKPSELS